MDLFHRTPFTGRLFLATFSGFLFGLEMLAQEVGKGRVTDSERQALRERIAALDARVAAAVAAGKSDAERAADVRVYFDSVQRVVDYEPVLDAKGRDQMEAALKVGEARLAHLEEGRHPWAGEGGRSLRGFVSAVDGSVQPYILTAPAGSRGANPMRLDIQLHGSMSRRSAIGVLDFLARGGATPAGNLDYLELQPLGRLGENAYRFEGETDVFEAIESVCRQFPVDRKRMVLRGSSLGGVGTWQIGLKRPDRFVALGPSAGPVDTVLFAAAPFPHFIKLDPFTPWQKKTLHMVDAIDYAANAGMVPVVAAMGEKDPYFPSHRQMEKAFADEGLPFTGLVAVGAGHGLNSATRAEALKQVGERAARPKPSRPAQIRFVTWTLAFSRCHWLEVLGLDAHYERAEIVAKLAADGSVTVSKASNVSRFALEAPALEPEAGEVAPTAVVIEGQTVAIPVRKSEQARALVFERGAGGWNCLGGRSEVVLSGKRPGLQGPIDDAFRSGFLCVRGTGQPVHEEVGRWAEANLRRFQWEWGRHYRGTLPVKEDTELTPEDLRDRNLVLFGDPGSNRWIREVLAALPVEWTPQAVRVGEAAASAAGHGLALIAPNPLPGAQGRYVVFNSGHTYHDPELRLSYMVFPRLGDWALIRVGNNPPVGPFRPPEGGPILQAEVDESVVTSGFFDEQWRPPGGR
jgi:hypothetical protein